MSPVSRRSTWPLYLQIADELREQILNDKLAPGQRLPSEHSLMEAYGASRQTIRKAIAELKAEGLLDPEQGRGVFVRASAPVLRSANELLSRRQWGNGTAGSLRVHAADGGPTVEVQSGRAAATAEVAARLGLREGAAVLVRRERLADDGRPLELATTYLPFELAHETPIEHEDISGDGLYACLEELGQRLDRFTERITTRMPRPAEARALDLGPGTPVVLIARTAWTVEGRPVAVSDEVMAADRYELLYEIPAGDRLRLVTTVEDTRAAMIGVVQEARECLVAVDSRSRDPIYLEAIEHALQERPRLVHYRLLIGPPHRQVLKDHLLRLLELRDPRSRDQGFRTLYLGLLEDPLREPERFFVASERAAVAVIPSFTTAGNLDTGVVFEHPQDARGLVQHGKQLIAGTQRIEDVEAVQALPVLK
jgi:GntR family transcriptional regulator